MGVGSKHDCEPLLAPGRHYMTLEEIEALCVTQFPGNVRRRNLYFKLEAFVQQFLVAGICCQIWVDGSFLTTKEDPNDLDVTVMIEPEVGTGLTPQQDALLADTNSDLSDPDLDSFAFILRSREDPLFADEHADPGNSWHELYGCEHSKQWLKGFAILRLRETHVGLRLCS
jgi:hypothetical protein